LEIQRIHNDQGWRWSIDDHLEIQPEGIRFHHFSGTKDATNLSEPTWPWIEGSIFEGPSFEAVKTTEGWEVKHESFVDKFDEDGHLISRSDPYNTQLSFHRKEGLLDEIRTSDGRFIRLLRNEEGQVSTAKLSDGREVYYEYRDLQISSVDSRTRARTRYMYDNSGGIRNIVWPDSSRVHIRRNGNAKVSSIHGPGAYTSSLSWTDTGVSIQSSTGATSRLTLLEEGYRFTDATGRSVQVVQDDSGVQGWLDPRGLETRILRNSKNQVVGIETPGGANWRMDWSGSTPTGIVDPAGGRWRLNRNSQGSVVSTTDPDGRTTRLSRNEHGLIRAIESGSAPLRISRDARGQIAAIQFPTGATSRIDRNAAGHVTRVQDPSGKAITLTGFVAGKPNTLIERDGGTWSLERDILGRVKGIDSPTGENIQIERDLSGRPIRLKTRSGTQVRYDWSADGVLTRVTDTRGGQYRLRYDSAGRLKLVDRPDGSQLLVEKEPNSEIVRIGPTTSPVTIRRDLRGNPLELDTLTWSWDAAGRWVGVNSNALGLYLPRSASGAVRSIQIQGESPIPIIRDAAGRVIALGRGEERVSLSRDPAGRLVGIQPPEGAPIRMDRDERGLVAIVHADSLTSRVLRDAAGRPLKWTSKDSKSVSAARDASGRVQHLRFPDGSMTRIARNEAELQLNFNSPNGQTFLERTVVRDSSGQHTQITESGLSNRTLTPRRDQLGNLVALETGTEAWSWLPGQIEGEGNALVILDAAGQPLEASPPRGPAAWAVANQRLVYLFDSDGRLERVVGETEHLSLEHDGLGRLTGLAPGERPGWVVEWDLLGWPSRITSPSGDPVTLIHDGTRLLGWKDDTGTHGVLPAMGFGAMITGASPWILPGDETGQVRAESQANEAPMALGFSPLGFPDRPPVHRISTPESWELFAGGPILDSQGARDPVSGLYTTKRSQPEWWPVRPRSTSWPKLDQSSSPWWSPTPWAAQSPWRDPLSMLVALDAFPVIMSDPWLSLTAPTAPVGWLPQEASSTTPRWQVSTDDIPIAASPLEAITLRAALAPSTPLSGEDILEALLGPEFQSLPSPLPVFGEDWRWWLMGIDAALLTP